MTEYAPALIMLGLLAANVRVAFAIGIAALFFFLTTTGVPLGVYVQRMVSVTHSFPLLAVPFFILAGVLMNHAGITRRLMALADAMVGHMIGGLAQVNVLLSTLMGGMSGSANADAAVQSKIIVPEMTKRGYAPGFPPPSRPARRSSRRSSRQASAWCSTGFWPMSPSAGCSWPASCRASSCACR
ncbi:MULTISPECIES: TRAP transporter large permease subunit [unclassified Roseitalea]|uniref:TRAP transporter large permease subunit n=1 Tax=unclassified Roseitalea TaxID=2639107 RepID=UPI00273DBAC3|nr:MULTISPECIES: TRAP transporter large permease subunit [unclassified Roseitalea]